MSSEQDSNSVYANGDIYTVKLFSQQTKNRLTILEAKVPPGGGPPRHNHQNEDEIFYVLAGELEITCGSDVYTATEGDLVHIPQGVMHSFTNKSPYDAKQLLIFAPGGFEHFFLELGEPVKNGEIPENATATDQEEARRIGAKYGSFQEEFYEK